MSKEKVAKLISLSVKDKAIYMSKRNHRSYWQQLSHKEWVAFCKEMGDWFSKDAPDEWDKYVKANNARKAKSDEDAVVRAALAKHKKK